MLCILFSTSSAQETPADSLVFKPDSTSISSTDSIFQMTKSPLGAVLRSAVLPGWGQYYNESYIKIPVVWGVLGWFAYNYIKNDNNYKDNRDLFVKTGIQSYQTLAIRYIDNRDLFALYFVLAYLANLADAYVDAHLFDFTVEEDFYTGKFIPTISIKVGL